MQDIYNGISATRLDGAVWRKSERSNSQGACVELARLDSTTVAMRNSRDPKGTALIYPADTKSSGMFTANAACLRAARRILSWGKGGANFFGKTSSAINIP